MFLGREMGDQNQQVYAYNKNIEALVKLLAYGAFKGKEEPVLTDYEEIKKLRIVKYLHGYLHEYYRDASEEQTIVVEDDYIDKDYTADYSGYYSRAFQSIPVRTTRIHFFNFGFSQVDFDNWLLIKPTSQVFEKLQTEYLGFIVVRPFHRRFVGRACLRQYSEFKGGKMRKSETPAQFEQSKLQTRHYTALNIYPVNLFGLPLSVTSIAFHEQDGVVGTCASSAIYSLLHGLKSTFDLGLRSGFEITQTATGYPMRATEEGNRAFPNTGLELNQIFHTLTSSGLSPTVISPNQSRGFQDLCLSTLYAYLSGGLPILAVVSLVSEVDFHMCREEALEDLSIEDKFSGKEVRAARPVANSPELEDSDFWSGERWFAKQAEIREEGAYHAFTITGFSIQPQQLGFGDDVVKYSSDDEAASPLLTRSGRMNKVYIHCDQIGAFARFEVQRLEYLAFKSRSLPLPPKNRQYQDDAYRDLWNDENVLSIPLHFVIPTHDHLRLEYQHAATVAEILDDAWKLKTIEWDIKISSLQQLRNDWVNNVLLSASQKLELLKFALPRFCWRVIARDEDGKKECFEVILDCTAVDTSTAILLVVMYGEDGRNLLELVVRMMKEVEPPNRRSAKKKQPLAVDHRVSRRLLSEIKAALSAGLPTEQPVA
jgi:hypothetical protein